MLRYDNIEVPGLDYLPFPFLSFLYFSLPLPIELSRIKGRRWSTKLGGVRSGRGLDVVVLAIGDDGFLTCSLPKQASR